MVRVHLAMVAGMGGESGSGRKNGQRVECGLVALVGAVEQTGLG